jgi:hypothetical protein
MPASITPYNVTLFCAWADPAATSSAREAEVNAVFFILVPLFTFQKDIADAQHTLINLKINKSVWKFQHD